MNFSLWLDDKEFKLNLEEKAKDDIMVSFGKRKYHVSVEFLSSDEILLNIDDKIHNVIVNSNSLSHSVYVNGRFFKIEKKSVSQILGRKGATPNFSPGGHEDAERDQVPSARDNNKNKPCSW